MVAVLIDANGGLFDHEWCDVDREFQDDRHADFTGMTAIFFVGFVADFWFCLDGVGGVEFSRHDCFNLGERLPYSGKGSGGFTVPMWVIFDGMKWILSKMGQIRSMPLKGL
jgi:hypothetical protein